MKKIIATGILLIAACTNAYCQDTTKVKSEKLPPYIENFGPFTVTVDDGKMTLTKNANYDYSKAVKRHPASPYLGIGAVEIYAADSTTPTIKKDSIYDMNSISSQDLMSKEERIKKYNSRAGVLVVHLKPGVVLVNEIDLLDKFSIPKKNYKLPLYVDYDPIARPDDLLAIPDAVLKIEIITDGDGFQFLNITTKEWDAQLKKYVGKDIIYIR